jgi:hypothetical protein
MSSDGKQKRLATALKVFSFAVADGRRVEVRWTPDGLDVSCEGEPLEVLGDGSEERDDRSVS